MLCKRDLYVAGRRRSSSQPIDPDLCLRKHCARCRHSHSDSVDCADAGSALRYYPLQQPNDLQRRRVAYCFSNETRRNLKVATNCLYRNVWRFLTHVRISNGETQLIDSRLFQIEGCWQWYSKISQRPIPSSSKASLIP